MPNFFAIVAKSIQNSVIKGAKAGIAQSSIGRFTSFTAPKSFLKNPPTNLPKPVLRQITNIGKAVDAFGTARYIAANPIGYALGVLKPLEKLREVIRVPIVRGRVVGLHSEARLKLSFLLDTVYDRKTKVDLTAYFRNPVLLEGKKLVEKAHPFLNVDAVTGNKSLYISGLALRTLGNKRAAFQPGFFRSFEEAIELSASKTIKQRWQNIFSSVRRNFRNSIRDAAEMLHKGEISEEDYLKRVESAYDRQRRLITLLSAGGIGRLSEDGLVNLNNMVRQKRMQFMEAAIDNLKRYQAVIQEEREARKEVRRVKDKTEKQEERAEKRKDVQAVMSKAVQDATSRNSKLNNYLRKRDPADPKLFIISSRKQSQIRQAFRRLFDKDAEDPFTIIFKMIEDTNLPSQMQRDLKDLFIEGYGDVLRAIRGSENSKEIEDKMGNDLMTFPHSYFDVGTDPIGNVEELQETLNPVDILNEIASDASEIEEGFRDGNDLDLAENENALAPKGTKVVYYRVTASGDECPHCSDVEFDIYDSFEEAREEDSGCYNVQYHGGRCYCQIQQAIVQEGEE